MKKKETPARPSVSLAVGQNKGKRKNFKCVYCEKEQHSLDGLIAHYAELGFHKKL